MITNTDRVNMLNDPYGKMVFWNDEYELCGNVEETKSIVEMFNSGADIQTVADKHNRHWVEVLNCLIDQFLKGKKVRPIAKMF